MFNKKPRYDERYQQGQYGQYPGPGYPPGPGQGPGQAPGQAPGYGPGYGPGSQIRRLEYQVYENTRRINRLSRRVRRIENYLGIREDDD